MDVFVCVSIIVFVCVSVIVFVCVQATIHGDVCVLSVSGTAAVVRWPSKDTDLNQNNQPPPSEVGRGHDMRRP